MAIQPEGKRIMLTTMLEPYDTTGTFVSGGKVQEVSFFTGHNIGHNKIITLPPDLSFATLDIMNWLGPELAGHAIGLRDLLLDINRTATTIYALHNTWASIHKKEGKPTGQETNISMGATQQIIKLTKELVWHLGLLCSAFYLGEYQRMEASNKENSWPDIYHLRDLFERSEAGDSYASELRKELFKNTQNNLVEPVIYEIVAMQTLMTSAWFSLRPLGMGLDHPTIYMISPPKDEGYTALLRNHTIRQIMAGIDMAVEEFGLFGKRSSQNGN